MIDLKNPIYFVSGIDTGVGKTVITGLLAKHLKMRGVNVITQKIAQTGCQGISEDILEHRRIAEMELLECDRDFTTCCYVFDFPASPHLSAELEGKSIDCSKISANSEYLKSQFDTVLLEGAGGLMVPLTRNYTTLDYIADQKLPLILVTTPKLGSINHTLMSLELCLLRGVEVTALVYNDYIESPKVITDDSKMIFREFLSKRSPNTTFFEVCELY